MRLFLIVALGAMLTCGGCQRPQARLNAPPHGQTTNTSNMSATMEAMIDNGLLENMVITDLHFIPHRALLNGLGEQRLSRMALLMQEYGGQIRFSTNNQDEELVNQRVAVIKDFLAEAGLDTTSEVVKQDVAGGAGISAEEAILIKVNEGMYNPEKSNSGSNSGGGL